MTQNTYLGHPAVAFNRYGNGYAFAFAYNLPLSIALTRQGNPALAGLETDGIPGLRGMDLFTGGWVDTTKNHINQADAQMSLLSRCIEHIAAGKKPLPRFWCFPHSLKCMVVLTNDGENNNETEFAAQFDDVEAKQASMTLYVKELDLVSNEKVKEWVERGHEISGHPDDTDEAVSPTWLSMDSVTHTMAEKIKRQVWLDHGYRSKPLVCLVWKRLRRTG